MKEHSNGKAETSEAADPVAEDEAQSKTGEGQ